MGKEEASSPKLPSGNRARLSINSRNAQSKKQDEPLTFANIARIESPFELPLILQGYASPTPPKGRGLNNHPIHEHLIHEVIEEIENFLDMDAVVDTRFELTAGGGRSLQIDFDADLNDAYWLDTITVQLDEVNPDGKLKITTSTDSIDCSVEINSALFLLWLAVAQPKSTKPYAHHLPHRLQQLERGFEKMRVMRRERELARERRMAALANTRLESVVVFLPGNHADGSMSPSEKPAIEFPDRLSPLKKSADASIPFSESFLAKENLSNLTKNVPSSFLGFQEERLAFWEQDIIERTSESIVYRFSDGAAITARAIYTTLYAHLVPPDLLPGGLEIPGSEQFWSRHFARVKSNAPFTEISKAVESIEFVPRSAGAYGDYKTSQREFLEKVMRGILASAFNRMMNREIPVELAFAPVKLDEPILRAMAMPKTVPSLRLHNIDLRTADLFEWRPRLQAHPIEGHSPLEVFVTNVTLTPKKASQIIALESGFLSLETGTFYPRGLASEIRAFRHMTYGHTIDQKKPSVSSIDEAISDAVTLRLSVSPFYEVEFTARGPFAGLELLRALRNTQAGQYPIADVGSLEASATPELIVDRDGRFSLSRRLASTSGAPPLSLPFLNGWSDGARTVLELLARGLPFVFRSEAKLMATKNKRHRDFELKLLKHQGILNLLVLEALNARLHGRLSDGTLLTDANSAQTVLGLLEPKILALMGVFPADAGAAAGTGASKKSSAPKLQEYCTKATIDRLKKFLAEILIRKDSGHYRELTPEGEIVIPGFQEIELQLIRTLLEVAAESSKGEIFAKARANVVKEFFPAGDDKLHRLRILPSRERAAGSNRPKADGAGAQLLQLPFKDINPRDRLRQTLAVLQELKQAGCEIFLDGGKIQELSEQDFRAELNLSEDQAAHGAGERAHDDSLVSRTLDWFELNPKFFLHGKELPASEAARFLGEGIIEYKGQYYLIPAARMPSLSKLATFWERLRHGKKSRADAFNSDSPHFPLGRSQVLEMLALRASGVPVIGGEKWREICTFYDQLDSEAGLKKFEVPMTVRAQLKEYQKIGVRRLYDLYRLGLGSVLADDMGLGKTLQTLTFLEKLRGEKRLGPVLLVVPTSLTYNWMSEREKFTPELPMMMFSPKAKEAADDFINHPSAHGVLLTTYGLLQEHADYFKRFNWEIALFDEAQNLKNISAQRTTTARSLKASIKICLTGTPLENHLGEYFSLLDLCVPGSLGDFDEFRKVYVNPTSIQMDDIRYLRLKTKPLVLRRTKAEILGELPEKQESRVVLPFEAKQKKIYRDIAISFNEKVRLAIAEQGEARSQLQMFTALLRLRQVCSDPAALPNIQYPKTPPKIESLAEALEEIVAAGESALVFTQFLHSLERVAQTLQDLGLPVFMIHGALARSQREKMLQEFNATAGGAVLLMTLKTGGVGLNLTKASYVFHLEPWWNPAVENQATDRAHRLGQKRAVQVYRYIMHESVEEKIESLKTQKQQRFDAMFTEVETSTSENIKSAGGNHLSKADFDHLLSLH